MEQPVLLIMAAGMGSRYGGLKQMDGIGPSGQVILDYSIYDAVLAGFKKAIFVINEEMQPVFEEKIGRRMRGFIEVEYCHQRLSALPKGCLVPPGREKPFGTGHAVLAAAGSISGPFAVINADDYYGRGAFNIIYKFLQGAKIGPPHQFAMVGYKLKNTMTENGHVSRGVCNVAEGGRLLAITERTRIEQKGGAPAYTEDDGKTYTPLHGDNIVSMNLFGLQKEFLQDAAELFEEFCHGELQKSPMTAEFYLPAAVSTLMARGKAEVQVLECNEKWYGVTYKEDRAKVAMALLEMEKAGFYPKNMLGL